MELLFLILMVLLIIVALWREQWREAHLQTVLWAFAGDHGLTLRYKGAVPTLAGTFAGR